MHILLSILPAKKMCAFLTTQVNTISMEIKCSGSTMIKPMHSLDPTFFTIRHLFVQILCFWTLSIVLSLSKNRPFFNVENVTLLWYKWNETVSNRIRYVCNRICIVSNEICNTCATSYVTADNPRLMAYLLLKVICN
jgi:hypothetical protein